MKLRIEDREALLRQLAKLKAKATGPRMHERNTLYDAEDGRLAQAGQMARIRVERPVVQGHALPEKGVVAKATLTFKGPPSDRRADGNYKIREEHEVQVASGEVLDAICRGLGLRPWFRYEKYRTPFRLPEIKALVIDLDETPVGDFVELEGPKEAIDRAARLLGFRKSDYIVQSYGGLFMDSLKMKGRSTSKRAVSKNEPRPGLGVPDMLFRAETSPQKRLASAARYKMKKN